MKIRPELAFAVLLVVLISRPSVPFASVPSLNEVDENGNHFNLQWKLPVGSAGFAAVSSDGKRILLPVFSDGYYLYNANGKLMWRLPDPYARFAEFSADGKAVLLGRDYEAKPSVSLVDVDSQLEKWNYTTYAAEYARLSLARNRAAVVALRQVPEGFRTVLFVKDESGNDLLNLTLNVGEFGYASSPAISSDGRFVAVGKWGSEGTGGWLYFEDVDKQKSWNATVQEGIQFVAMSANASLVVAAGYGGLYSFDQNGHMLWSASLPDIFGYIEPFPNIAVSANGEYVAVAGGGVRRSQGYATLFDRNGTKLWEEQVPSTVTAFAMENQASEIVVGDSKGGIYIFNRSGMLQSTAHLVSNAKSVAVGGNPTIVAAVGSENVMYLMDSQTRILWIHEEIGSQSKVAISNSGDRVLVGGVLVINGKGKKVFGVPLNQWSSASALSSDGNTLVIAEMAGQGFKEEPFLKWYDLNTGRMLSNVSLGADSRVDSLEISSNGNLTVVSGNIQNFTYIRAFNSNGRSLWKFFTRIREVDPDYHDFSWVESHIAVSADGQYVAVARREVATYRGGHCCDVGPNNGVVLFDADGVVVWNYTTQDWIWNSAISGDGEFVAAGGSSQIYMFKRSGELLWSLPVLSGSVALSKDHDRLVAGHFNGGLFLGNSSGVYWQMGVDGHVESVSISNDGAWSAGLVYRDYPNDFRLLYVLNRKGQMLGNFTYHGQSSGFDQVALSGNGCCIISSIEDVGLYYYARNLTATQTSEPGKPVQSIGVANFAIPLGVGIFVATIAALVYRKARSRHRNPHNAAPIQ